VNASNLEKDFAWLQTHCPPDVRLENVSDRIALLAIQGPKSRDLVQSMTKTDISAIKFYWFDEGEIAEVPVTLSRTGYTGERGYELDFEAKHAKAIWNAVTQTGEKFGLGLCGLGARDTLRLEMNYRLYGNDIDETTHPLEASLGWITKLKKGEFIGCEAILEAKTEGLKRKLIGLEIEGRIPARHGYDVMSKGNKIGTVASGTFSPTLQKAIATAYVELPFAENGTSLIVNARGRDVTARVVPTPFYPGDPSKD